jgi:hypothetical protein
MLKAGDQRSDVATYTFGENTKGTGLCPKFFSAALLFRFNTKN